MEQADGRERYPAAVTDNPQRTAAAPRQQGSARLPTRKHWHTAHRRQQATASAAGERRECTATTPATRRSITPQRTGGMPLGGVPAANVLATRNPLERNGLKRHRSNRRPPVYRRKTGSLRSPVLLERTSLRSALPDPLRGPPGKAAPLLSYPLLDFFPTPGSPWFPPLPHAYPVVQAPPPIQATV